MSEEWVKLYWANEKPNEWQAPVDKIPLCQVEHHAFMDSKEKLAPRVQNVMQHICWRLCLALFFLSLKMIQFWTSSVQNSSFSKLLSRTGCRVHQETGCFNFFLAEGAPRLSTVPFGQFWVSLPPSFLLSPTYLPLGKMAGWREEERGTQSEKTCRPVKRDRQARDDHSSVGFPTQQPSPEQLQLQYFFSDKTAWLLTGFCTI